MAAFGVGANAFGTSGAPASMVTSGTPPSGAAAIASPSAPTVTAISDAGAGAASTARHWLGKLAMVIRSRAFGASGFLLGRHGSGVNHQASDLSQPSPGGVGACGLQLEDPGWQPMRTWKW